MVECSWCGKKIRLFSSRFVCGDEDCNNCICNECQNIKCGFCSACGDEYVYCRSHVSNHEHVTEDQEDDDSDDEDSRAMEYENLEGLSDKQLLKLLLLSQQNNWVLAKTDIKKAQEDK